MLETYRNPDVMKVTRMDTVKQAKRWLEKNRSNWKEELHIGTNKKDGIVIYYYR